MEGRIQRVIDRQTEEERTGTRGREVGERVRS